MNKNDICFMSACDMVKKIKAKDLSSLEITEIFIERIKKVNPIINAYCTPTFELAKEMAKKADDAVKRGEKLGKLHGIPTSIKDLMQTKGIRTTYGSKLYENFIPEQDDIAVQRLKNAGCVIMGKTNTPEFGHLAVTQNKVFGETKNPWNLERTSGGSSGGAAASIASGLGPLALGSDGGGSIRLPSCFCGVYGLKPTFGRVPRYPTVGISFWSMDHYGPIVRYVKDAALMLDVMKGFHPSDKNTFPDEGINYLGCLKDIPKKLKIGYSIDLGFNKAIESEVEKKFLDSVQKFNKFSWDIENAKIKLRKPEFGINVLASMGYGYDLKKELEKRREDLSPDLVRVVEAGISYNAFDIGKAWAVRQNLYEFFYRFFENYDILLTPTTPLPAFELGIPTITKIAGRGVSFIGFACYTYPFNMTGLPAASIPCGFSSDGLPIGMQIIGRRYDELTVLKVSKAFEEITPWQDKKPQF
ncbi:MAG: amidase [Candidatus Hermodarchaeota archaeon]